MTTGCEIAFDTRDIHLAWSPQCEGHDVTDPDAEVRLEVFASRDQPLRRDDALARFGSATVIPSPACSITVRDMRALLHHA